MSPSDLADIRRGSHACWVVADDDAFLPIASGILARANKTREKTYAFGPAGGEGQRALSALGASVMDPFVDILGGRSLDPELMFAAFRRNSDRALDEGYAGVRVVADMDWLLGAAPTPEETTGFELLLDRVAGSINTTVVCMYRIRSFERGTIESTAAVHPIVCGASPIFRLTAAPEGWTLSGEIDISVRDSFSSALATLLRESPATLDLSGLRFIDCAGMRALADAVASHPGDLLVRSVPDSILRAWTLAGFAQELLLTR